MQNSNSWGIIGLGWLGQQMAARLADSQVTYWGTKRTDFDWRVNPFPQTPCDILLLNTPPLPDISPEEFVHKIPGTGYHHIIFISSIAVYGSTSGTITETSATDPTTQNGSWLVQVEKLLLQKFSGRISIIRAGGLIGGSRHPVKSLALKSGPPIKNSVVNLIHRDDLIDIIFAVANADEKPPLLNAVTPYHPRKQEYYGFWTEKLGLKALVFEADLGDQKIIASEILPTLYPSWHFPNLD